MIKASDVIGNKIITIDDGKEVGKVEDIVYDPKENKVKALLLDEGGWFSDAKVILLEHVESIGEDAVLINSEDLIRKASEVSQRVASIAKEDNYLTKTRIVTDTGNELGRVSDIYFDPKTGNVQEFEVSQGLENIKSGKKRISIDQVITVGEDATIVKGIVEQEVYKQAQEGGLQGTIKQAVTEVKEKTPQVAEQVRSKASELSQEAENRIEAFRKSPKTQQMIDEAKQKTQEIKEGISDKAQELKDQEQRRLEKMEEDKRIESEKSLETSYTEIHATISKQQTPKGSETEYTVSKEERVPPSNKSHTKQ